MKQVTIGEFTGGRDNNFNLLRFLAAALVILSHSYSLSYGNDINEPLNKLAGFTFGTLAVDIFFITSGFLVTQSLLRRKGMLAFLFARVMRIFPGLIVAVAFSVFVIGAIFTTIPAGEFLERKETWIFLIRNSTLVGFHLQLGLPGVFEHNPFAGVVNGSLWTLPWEVAMYITLMVAGLAHGRTRSVLIPIIGAVALAAYLALPESSRVFPDFVHKGSRLLAFFYLGACFYLYRDYIVLSSRIAGVLLLISCGFIGFHVSWYFAIYPLTLAWLVFFLAFIPSGRIRNFNRLGDYSYGIYVYAFPVQQSVAKLLPGVSPLEMFAIALPVTLGFAIASWHFVERPSLRRKNDYLFIERTLARLRGRRDPSWHAGMGGKNLKFETRAGFYDSVRILRPVSRNFFTYYLRV